MPVKWITVKHEKTGGETRIPEKSARGYCARGWKPVDAGCCGLHEECPLKADAPAEEPAAEGDAPAEEPAKATTTRKRRSTKDESGDDSEKE